MAQLASFGGTAPDITAVCQQAALVACVYQNDRTRAEQLLGDDGVILRWVHQPDTWPPSYAVIRSGTGRYFVVLAGTTNINQAYGHVQGTFWRARVAQDGVVNGQWIDAWERMNADIRSALPPEIPTATVHFSGHSYGGAVGLIGASEYAAEIEQARVQLMTFGAPRAYAVGWLGPLPAIHWRIDSNQDIVSYLPLVLPIPGADFWTLPVPWRIAVTDWAHNGRGRYLAWNGQYDYLQPAPDPTPEGVAVGPVNEHKLRNYWGRLRQRLLNVESTPEAVAALAIMDGALTGGPVQPVTPALPKLVRGPGVQEIPVPFWDGVPPPLAVLSRGVTMPFPTPLAGGRAMKVTQVFNADRQGWSESHFLFVTGDGDPYKLCELWAERVNTAQRRHMPDDYLIEAVRISDAAIDRDSSLTELPNLMLGKGAKTGTPADPQLGWQLLHSDATNQVHVTRLYRGWVTADIPYSPVGGRINPTIPMTVQNWQLEMSQLLTRAFTAAGVVGTAVPCMQSYPRNPADNPRRLVDLFALNGDGRLTARLASTLAFDATVGSVVHVYAKRKKCLRGVSGEARVIGVALDAGKLVLTLDKHLCCGTSQLQGLIGEVQLRSPSYYAIDEASLGHSGSRDVGSAFFVTAGHRPAKCC